MKACCKVIVALLGVMMLWGVIAPIYALGERKVGEGVGGNTNILVEVRSEPLQYIKFEVDPEPPAKDGSEGATNVVPQLDFRQPSEVWRGNTRAQQLIAVLMPQIDEAAWKRVNTLNSMRTWVTPEYVGSAFDTERYLERGRNATGRDMLRYEWVIRQGGEQPPVRLLFPVVVWQYPVGDLSPVPFEAIGGVGVTRDFW